ncbi:hypothetical protein ACFYVL_04650 [Streptomyces sp. NPDC004111]|uniref:hypothetical protein n=1 Tax=Streptomyces sp. NPDC004111 TaxID=3364690 RepID=UPI0036BC9725
MATVPWRGSRRNVFAPLRLQCAQRVVGVEAALLLPNVMVLVVEDVCTRLAYEDWQRRRPARWHLVAHRRWRAEGIWLEGKFQRLWALAGDCLDCPD